MSADKHGRPEPAETTWFILLQCGFLHYHKTSGTGFIPKYDTENVIFAIVGKYITLVTRCLLKLTNYYILYSVKINLSINCVMENDGWMWICLTAYCLVSISYCLYTCICPVVSVWGVTTHCFGHLQTSVCWRLYQCMLVTLSESLPGFIQMFSSAPILFSGCTWFDIVKSYIPNWTRSQS